MAQLKPMEFYKWSVIKAIAPDYAVTIVLVVVALYLQRLPPGLYGDFSWLRNTMVSLPFFGLCYPVLIGFSLLIGWENVLTRRTHRRVEKALRQGREGSEP
jgi:hypothetical protein